MPNRVLSLASQHVFILAGLLASIMLLSGGAAAAEPAGAPSQPVALWPKGAPHPDRPTAQPAATETKLPPGPNDPALIPYLPVGDRPTAAIIICPGGGYRGLALEHEGHDIARYFVGQKMAAFVLKYRLPRSQTPGAAHGVPLADAQRALRTVRDRATDWHIDPAKVGILGFSAGGHLASTAATHFDNGHADSADKIDRLSSRPDFAVLIYPVISSDPKIWHKGSFVSLVGPRLDPKMLELYSNERHVTAQTPPVFLVHAADDRGVPVGNSLRFFEALQKAGVPAEMHIYERGGHGFGMRPQAGPAAGWPDLAIKWLKLRGVL